MKIRNESRRTQKVKRKTNLVEMLHDWLELPVYRNQMQRDLSRWIEDVRFKEHRRRIAAYNSKLQVGK